MGELENITNRTNRGGMCVEEFIKKHKKPIIRLYKAQS